MDDGRSGAARELNVVMLIVCAASLLHSSMGFAIDNHAVQIPLINLLRDPSLYPGDPFARALVSYPSTLWPLVAELSRLVPLGPLLMTLLAGERLLTIYAARRLASAFAPRSKLAAIGAMVLFGFAIHPLLGEGTIVAGYFEQTGLATAFLLLAMASFYERRPIPWAIWTALAFNASNLYGIYAVTYFAWAFLADRAYLGYWRRWTGAIGLFLMVSSYAIVLGLRTVGHPVLDTSLWLAASHARSWWHLYPLEWAWRGYAEVGAFTLFLALVLAWGGPAFLRLRRHAMLWSVVAGSWVIFAFLAAYVITTPHLLLLQSARGTDLWVSFSAVAIVAITASKVERWHERALAAAPHVQEGS